MQSKTAVLIAILPVILVLLGIVGMFAWYFVLFINTLNQLWLTIGIVVAGVIFWVVYWLSYADAIETKEEILRSRKRQRVSFY